MFLPFIAYAQSAIKVETIILDKPDYYKWLTSLSLGPKKWNKLIQEEYENAGENVVVGKNYRVAVATSEIYSTVYIEEITQGSEGCCMKLRSIQKLDLYDFQKKFKLKDKLGGFKVLGWENYSTFIFTIHGREFKAFINGINNVEIEEKIS